MRTFWIPAVQRMQANSVTKSEWPVSSLDREASTPVAARDFFHRASGRRNDLSPVVLWRTAAFTGLKRSIKSVLVRYRDLMLEPFEAQHLFDI